MAQAKRKEKERAADSPASGQPAPAAEGSPVPWQPPQPLSRGAKLVLVGVVLLANLPLIHYALRGEQEATVQVPFRDDFSDRTTVEKNYWTNGGYWRTVNGQLLAPGVKNNPLWLKAKLPRDAVVEFDVRSESPEGDIKCEIFGDGLDHASGYVLIHGGWNNSVSVIARLDEHGPSLALLQQEARKVASEQGLPQAGLVDTGVFRADTRMRVEANPYPVQIGKTYHWRIERKGTVLRWSIDGKPFMEFDDPFPLGGKGHDRFGFSSWEAQLYFDNLSIQPL
ncbi:MAG TPA: hypothetical protein VFT91_02340 [Dehalococcoidia bacterium]|nr:hypothetical protein [Dehalococcoidia bacterium]